MLVDEILCLLRALVLDITVKETLQIAVAYLKSKSVTWSSANFNSLGSEFAKAVGYAGGQANTNDRIGLGKGFYQRIIAGELLPRASLTTTTPIDKGAGTSQVQ